jgi:hypothetical protein
MLDVILSVISTIVLVRGRKAATLYVFGGANLLGAAGFVYFAISFHSAVPLFAAAALQLAFAALILRQGHRLQLEQIARPTSPQAEEAPPPEAADSSLTGGSR